MQGYKQVSLSVQKMNYAVHMYLKVGFEIVDENDEGRSSISGFCFYRGGKN